MSEKFYLEDKLNEDQSFIERKLIELEWKHSNLVSEVIKEENEESLKVMLKSKIDILSSTLSKVKSRLK